MRIECTNVKHSTIVIFYDLKLHQVLSILDYSLHLVHSQILHQVLSLLDSTFATYYTWSTLTICTRSFSSSTLLFRPRSIFFLGCILMVMWLATPGQLSQSAPGLPTVQLYHYGLGSAITMVDYHDHAGASSSSSTHGPQYSYPSSN